MPGFFQRRPRARHLRHLAAALVLVLGLAKLPANAAPADWLYHAPVVGRDAGGHLEVFKVDNDGQVRHSWRKQSDGDWSSWMSLGGVFLPGIAVVTTGNGLLEVFAVKANSGDVWRISQKEPNSHEWTDWACLHGEVEPPLSAALGSNGRVWICGLAPRTGALRCLSDTGGAEGPGEWSELGGNLQPGVLITPNADGRLEVFGVDATTQSVVHRSQQHQNDNHWSAWSSLGGTFAPGFGLGRNKLGWLEVFAVAQPSGNIERSHQTTPGSATWSPWEELGAQAKPGLAVGQSSDARLEVMAVDARDNMLLHRWETLTNGADLWSLWAALGAPARPYPAVGQNEDGDLEVFALDLKDPSIINHRQQISRASDWLDWSSLGHKSLRYTSRTWQTDDGLPDNRVQAIAQTADGYLWVGTHGGLARFDGLGFTSLGAETSPWLKKQSVGALCADHSGPLWIGTEGAGLVELDKGRCLHLGRSDGLAGDNVRALYQTRGGALWVGTTEGVNELKDSKLSSFTRKEGLLSDNVSSFFEDRDGNLWIGTGLGLNRLRNGRMESFAMPNQLPGDSVRGICQDKGGRIWIGSNNGMLWFSWYWTNFYAYNTRYGLSDSFVSTICEDTDGSLWVGTYSGLNRFRDGRFFAEFNNQGMAFDRVNALFQDRESNLWVGSRDGLVRLTPKRFNSLTKRDGLTHNNVTSVLEDRSGGIWLGTWGGGLNCLKDEEVIGYAATNGFFQSLVLSLCESSDGSLWFGADFDGGLARLKQGRFSYYTTRDGLPGGPIRAIHEDHEGRLWVGAANGLGCLQQGQFTNYPVPLVRAICQTTHGTLWFATENGLVRLDHGDWSRFTSTNGLSDDFITALYEDADRNLWVGTAGGGLNLFRDGVFHGVNSRQGLFSDEIFEILEDDDGWLWMSCSKGVFRAARNELLAVASGTTPKVRSLSYSRSDGLESPQCGGLGKPGAWKASDGRLWFPTSKGVVVVDPRHLPLNPDPPPVHIDLVMADQVARSRAAGSATGSSVVRIPPGSGELEFHFSVLNYRAPEKCQVEYRLRGESETWVPAGLRRSAQYANVAPGNYHFEVRACNEDGVWNLQGAEVGLMVLPHFWQTWWFQIAIGLLVLGCASGAARWITKRRLQRRLAQLEQRHAIEKERRRIAKDMHDQLGAGLTQMGLLGELARRDVGKPERARTHAERICEIAREQAQTLDEIVWTVEPKNDVLNKLGAYIAVYAEDFFRAAPIRCRLEIPPGLPPIPVPSDLRHNLFLALKEALNNVVKHSQATETTIRLTLSGEALLMIVKDNGRGFAPDTADRTGNGLSSMRERVLEAGGDTCIQSEPGQGTTITFTVPLPKSSLVESSP